MTVKELIDQLMDCRSDADVMSSLFDNCTEVTLVKGTDNRGNYVVLFEKIAYDSPRIKIKKEK